MEVDGIRFTIPTIICPRYGNYPGSLQASANAPSGKISITVDADIADESFIQTIQSPTHPISMTGFRKFDFILRGTSAYGPFELEISVQALGPASETFHQVVARKAVSELEHGHGWLSQAKDKSDILLISKFDGRFDDTVERETVGLGV
ncbi:hypothetical protein BDU57DRAFT_546934 [Ampelomyces quisqualis]|uniref:Uncharacterized protein n=1 Tax=Ampelomyces quisqualis TaxID=50730 RepID=A0A6A5QT38_AMPQU|nr:hypothetical protein BDU57DRAFT_546934 [Ampelomyces quisqualis]